MKVCTSVIERCVETLDEQSYLPNTVRGTLSINTYIPINCLLYM